MISATELWPDSQHNDKTSNLFIGLKEAAFGLFLTNEGRQSALPIYQKPARGFLAPQIQAYFDALRRTTAVSLLPKNQRNW